MKTASSQTEGSQRVRAATPPDPLDGRTARRLANRDRILDAALDLVAEGAEVDVETIADRAGVSVRSVYNHFSTARELIAGMYERGSAKVGPLVEDLPDATVPFDERVDRWVRVWSEIQEEIAAIRWRALIAEAEHPELQPELKQLRTLHRAQIRGVFPEIDTEERRRAVVAMTDSLAWRSLRKHQGLSVEAARDVIGETIRRMRG
jgi:AcrR family transcriptional regulator